MRTAAGFAAGVQAANAGMTGPPQRLRVLMLHSFRTSAAIFKQQMQISGLDRQLNDLVEMIFVDAPNAASGPIPKDVQPFFASPFREWWNFMKQDDGDSYSYVGFDESVAYVEDKLREHAPVHGLCGFSQGAALSALLVSFQRQGRMLQGVDQLQFCVLFAGVQSRLEEHHSAYTQPIACPSLHIIGDRDPLRPVADNLAECFENAEVIRHRRGHVIANLPNEDVTRMRKFLEGSRPDVAQASL